MQWCRGCSTVIVDRGMAYEKNLAQIRAHRHRAWFDELQHEQGWAELIRLPSPRSSSQRK